MALRPRRRESPFAAEQPGPVEGSVIRRARPGDQAAVIALRALMFEAMGTPTPLVSSAAWQSEAARWLQLHLTDPDVNITVAVAHDVVVSCAIGQVVDLMPSPVRQSPYGGLVTNVATFPGRRRLGFSEACITAVLDWFRDSTQVDVVTLNATEEARASYERLGFVVNEHPEMRLTLVRDEPAPDDTD